LLLTVACRDAADGVRTEYVGAYPFTASERRTITRIAEDAARDARRHLPALPQRIIFQARSGKDVIPEIGATAVASSPEFVRWTVDAARPEGVITIAENNLRATLFHEFHHLVRGTTQPIGSLMEHVIAEGMATAFERDFAGATYPWGQYPADVTTWVEELRLLPPEAEWRDWIAKTRPDGRRWVGMRAGTYLVDQAMKTLHRTSAQLVSVPAGEILAAAGVPPR
jgi:hypothetical protein